MAIVRFEAWTRPQTGTFERKFPIRGVIDYSLELGIFGRGEITLPSNHPRIDDILYIDPTARINDKGSLIRAYIDDMHLFDFYAQRTSTNYGETGTRETKITGTGPGYALEKTVTRQYDYPVNPPIEPDWHYGFGPNLVQNGDAEETPEGGTNLGAEDGTTLGWYTTGDWVTNQNLPERFEAIEGAGAHSGDWYFEIEAGPYEGAIKRFSVVDEKTYVISVWVKMAAGLDHRVSVDGVSECTVGTMYNNSCYVDVVGTGAYQDVGLAFTADGNEARLHITSMEYGGVVQFDDVTMTGFGTGTDPWTIRGDITTFEATDAVAHAGTYSFTWKPLSGISGNDMPYQTINVVAGQNLTAKAWFYHTEAAARNMRLTIRIPGVNPNATNVASVVQSVAPYTWTEFVASGVSPTDTVELELRWDEDLVPANNINADDIQMYRGRPQATLGFIFGEQLDDAATNHAPGRTALAWLTKTFSDTVDSGAVAWDQTLAMSVPRGGTLRRLTETSVDRWEYEARMRVDPTDHTVYWLDLFNKGGMGTDYTTTDGNAVTNSGMVAFGPIIRIEPQATYVMVEGDEHYFGEATNANTKTSWGELEAFQSSDEMFEGTLDAVASGLVSGKESQTVSAKFKEPMLVPGVDYELGDTVMLVLGEDILTAGAYRVYSIVIDADETTPTYQVQFGQIEEGT